MQYVCILQTVVKVIGEITIDTLSGIRIFLSIIYMLNFFNLIQEAITTIVQGM